MSRNSRRKRRRAKRRPEIMAHDAVTGEVMPFGRWVRRELERALVEQAQKAGP